MIQLGMAVDAINPSREISEFKASLVSRVSSRKVKATYRNFVPKAKTKKS